MWIIGCSACLSPGRVADTPQPYVEMMTAEVVMSQIVRTYADTHPGSRSRFREAVEFFPDGVTHDGRYLEPFPVYMTEGRGGKKRDVDGNEYIDYVMGHGALLLGHCHPELVRAVQDQIVRGTHLGASTDLELAWARRVKSLIPSVEKIRFHSSGTEAIAMATRLARARTGRDAIVKFDRHFHGWSDAVVHQPGRYSSAGIPAGADASTVRIDPLNRERLEKILEGKKVAAVIVEPTGAQMGSYPIPPAFLRELRELTKTNGTLLIFDEIVTGFRVSPGGAQVRFGIEPDLSALGKILGGGLPAAATAGRADVMDMIGHRPDEGWNTTGRVGHPGTFNANPLSAAAGVACLDLIAAGGINEKADAMASRLKTGFNTVLREKKVPGVAHGASSIIKVVFGVSPPESEEQLAGMHREIASSADPEIHRFFRLAMLNNGADAMGGGRFIVSAVHTESDIDATVEAFGRSISAMGNDGVLANL